MKYKKLLFDGDILRWITEIIDSQSNMLLLPPNQGPQNLPTLDQRGSDTLIGLFTSASTGSAKCIWNTFDKLLMNATITAREFEISRKNKLLMMAKPWHIAGLSWMLMAEQIGAAWNFVPSKKGEVEKWYHAILESEADYLLTVPAVLRRLFSYDDWFIPNIVFGGSPLAYEDYEPLFRHCDTIYQGYGQTEAGGLMSSDKLKKVENLTEETCRCYGRHPEEFDIQCEGSLTDPQPIWLKSPTAIHKDYYDTGDLGYIGVNNLLHLTGRIW